MLSQQLHFTVFSLLTKNSGTILTAELNSGYFVPSLKGDSDLHAGKSSSAFVVISVEGTVATASLICRPVVHAHIKIGLTPHSSHVTHTKFHTVLESLADQFRCSRLSRCVPEQRLTVPLLVAVLFARVGRIVVAAIGNVLRANP